MLRRSCREYRVQAAPLSRKHERHTEPRASRRLRVPKGAVPVAARGVVAQLQRDFPPIDSSFADAIIAITIVAIAITIVGAITSAMAVAASKGRWRQRRRRQGRRG